MFVLFWIIKAFLFFYKHHTFITEILNFWHAVTQTITEATCTVLLLFLFLLYFDALVCCMYRVFQRLSLKAVCQQVLSNLDTDTWYSPGHLIWFSVILDTQHSKTTWDTWFDFQLWHRDTLRKKNTGWKHHWWSALAPMRAMAKISSS